MNPNQNTSKGGAGVSLGKKPITRVGTSPVHNSGGLGIGYNEIKHNILAPGHGFLGGNIASSGGGQMEGRGISNFFMKKMGGSPVIMPPGASKS